MIIDITDKLGLPARLNLKSGEINFGVPVRESLTRTLRDVVKTGVVYKSEEIPPELLDKVVCRIYRFINDDEVTRIQGTSTDSTQGVKFDITVLLPYTSLDDDWQLEYPKTTGHYHLEIPGLNVASPDFYQVIHGKSIILLQRMIGKKIEAFAVSPEPLEPVIMSPDLGHIMVNIGNEPLVFANICTRAPHLNYNDIRRFNGGAYFFVRGATGEIKIIPNKKYEQEGYSITDLKKLRPVNDLPQLQIVDKKPIYEYIKENGVAIGLLTRPDKYMDLFKRTLI